jgi:putative membrane protein
MIDTHMRDRIEAAIKAVETKSRAELVAIIAARSGEYRATGLVLAILGAFLTGFVCWALWPWVQANEVLLAQLVAFIVLLAVLELTPLGDLLTPGWIKSEAARRLARAQFLERGLADTKERSAMLFFVSLAERHVEIIADSGIAKLEGAANWQVIVDDFVAKVRAGKTEDGFIAAIGALGEILAKHFPAGPGNVNEVGDRLIEI